MSDIAETVTLNRATYDAMILKIHEAKLAENDREAVLDAEVRRRVGPEPAGTGQDWREWYAKYCDERSRLTVSTVVVER